MSSTRKPQARPGPAPERKAAPGPVLTPQVLIVVFIVLMLIGVGIIINNRNKAQAEEQRINAAIATANRNKQTYKQKQDMLPVANQLNTTVRDKLNEVQYMFLSDQSSMVPFWEDDLFPILDESRMYPTDDSVIKAEVYTFHINMAMKPFNTLPSSVLFDDAYKLFPIEYQGEKDGQVTDEPLDTMSPDFLHPYTITFEKWGGDYEAVKQFVDRLQRKSNRAFYTVHCLKNDESKNFGVFRTQSEWTVVLTVYFMNPEASASGDSPPALPGANKC